LVSNTNSIGKLLKPGSQHLGDDSQIRYIGDVACEDDAL
jgi:hypothetical protein